MSLKINGKRFYRTNEACRKAGIGRATLFRWLKGGIFTDVKYKDRRGWRLFTDEDIERLKNEAQKIETFPSQLALFKTE